LRTYTAPLIQALSGAVQYDVKTKTDNNMLKAIKVQLDETKKVCLEFVAETGAK